MHLPIKIGLNTSQIYVQVDINGGCKLYVPAANKGQALALKDKLKNFAANQSWDLDHGGNVA